MSFFKSLEKAVGNLGNDISREVNYLSRDVSRGIDSVASSPLLDQLRTGNVVQLISRSSGHCLQIVMSPANTLVVDGMGPEGPNVYHAHWNIINLGKNIIQLHNNHNYIAIVNGNTVVGNFPPPAVPGPETQFRTIQHSNFVALQSITEPGRYVGILPNGQIKPAIATGAEHDSHFGIRLIFVAQAATVQTVTTTTTTAKPAKK